VTLSASATRLLAAVVKLGGDCTPGEAGTLAELAPRTVARAGQVLRAAGLVEGGKQRLRLTAAGRVVALEAQPISAGVVLDQALAVWADLGLYPHRAFLEMLCSAIAGRFLLGQIRPEEHLGFMASGRTGSGKSALAAMAREVFGLPRAQHTLNLPSQTVGAVLGRREAAPGGGQRWVPAPIAALPFVLFDEFDKADEPVRKAVLPYFQGNIEVQAEGETHRLLPTPMLAANTPKRGDRLSLLREEYRRRSVVLDTAYAEHRGTDIGRALTGYYEQGRPPYLDLAALPTPPVRLPPSALAALDAVTEALTPDGQLTLPSRRMLEAAALGRAALAGDITELGLTWAAYGIGVAYLTVTEQFPGEVNPGWALDFSALRSYLNGHGDLDTLEQVVTASRAAQAQAHARVHQSRVEREVEDLDLVKDRSALAEQLRLAAEDLDGRKVPLAHDKPTAAGLRAQLKTMRVEVQNCKSSQRLEDLRAIASVPLAEAVALRGRLDKVTQDRLREQRDAVTQRQHDKTVAAQHAATATAQHRRQQHALRADLTATRRQARTVEKLWNRHSTSSTDRPWEVLAEMDVLRFHANPQPAGNGVRALLANYASAGQGIWVVTGARGVSFPGTRSECPELRAWGENTRAALLPWLLELHRHEDALLQRIPGGRPRVRPELYQPTRQRVVAAPGRQYVLTR
jgi:hypothetical protein